MPQNGACNKEKENAILLLIDAQSSEARLDTPFIPEDNALRGCRTVSNAMD